MTDQSNVADALQSLPVQESAWLALNGAYFWFSMATVVIYDHMSTFNLEIELVWKKQWSLIKALYIINRYVPDACFLYGAALIAWIPDEQFVRLCPSLSRVQTLLSVIALFSMQAILVHRTISMYHQNRPVVIGVLIGYGLIFAAGLVLATLVCMTVVNVPMFFTRSIRTCVPTSMPPWSVASWFLMMIFDLAIVTLTTFEGLRYIRESWHSPDVRFFEATGILAGTRWSKGGTMVRILLRDSIFFPLIGLLICTFNALAHYVLPVGAIGYMVTITVMVTPILGCRLILHLRDAYYRPFGCEITKSIGSMTPDLAEMPEFVLQSMSLDSRPNQTGVPSPESRRRSLGGYYS